MAKVLILTALPAELPEAALALLGSRAAEFQVAFTGVGKINAALATLQALQKWQPRLVINFGTAGKVNSDLHGLIDIGKVIQRDMLTMPLAARGVTPYAEHPVHFLSECGPYVCGTGDSFVTAADPWLNEQGVDVVDMELFAIAQACHTQSVPWAAYKYITDDANADSAHDWQANVHKGATLFMQRLLAE